MICVLWWPRGSRCWLWGCLSHFIPVLFMIRFSKCHDFTWLYSRIILMYDMCALVEAKGFQMMAMEMFGSFFASVVRDKVLEMSSL